MYHAGVRTTNIKDAIKRRRERGSTGVSSTPKTKPSPIQNAKHSTTLPGKGPANKKRSHRAQNDYEMVDSIVSDKSNTVSTLPNSRGDYKDAIIEIEIPDEQNMAERLPATKLLPQDEQEQQYDLPIFVNDNDSLPVDNGPVIPDHEESEEESADEKTSTNSFIPHETQGNGLTREGSLEGSKRGEELVHDHKGSVDGVVNHIYEKPPDEYVPSYDEIHRRDEARLNLEDEDTAVENTDEISTENSLIPHNTQENTELKREGSLEGSMSRKDAESELGSIDGITNRIYENAPDEYDPSFVEIPGNDEVRLFLGERHPSSSSSSSSDTEVGSVEFSTEFNPVIDQEDVSCAVGDAPLEGALPSNSDETPVRRTAKKVEPREFDDDVKNDEDFERIMTYRRAKVDVMQRAADGFKIQTSSVQTSSSQSMWQKVRGKIHKGSYKVTKHGVTQDGVTQHDGASDESENKDDVSDDVDDIELV
ncbi:hypothetical protein OS493_001694 [Desmophyllum pertusum]|uniref:Uncharacterized protein n=1 Tax=Desmophyllum pertusum TaxID=174260 RepID=A0A9X0CVK1_9CNID|nr:hypothetical protein OS493_001694 [Desmophyllum pertusum]